jgi:NADH-quinone oxidoreductase subunit A
VTSIPYYYFGREGGKFALFERNMQGLPLERVSPVVPRVSRFHLNPARNSNPWVALLKEADFTMIFCTREWFFLAFPDANQGGPCSIKEPNLTLAFPLFERNPQRQQMDNLEPLFVYIAVLIGFVATNLLLAQFAAPRKKSIVKEMPYESGMDPVGDARQPYDVRFYLVAILFLVFDVELLFLYPWAVSAYVPPNPEGGAPVGVPVELRGTVFAVMLVFMATLVIAYIYAWRKGVFRWR